MLLPEAYKLIHHHETLNRAKLDKVDQPGETRFIQHLPILAILVSIAFMSCA